MLALRAVVEAALADDHSPTAMDGAALRPHPGTPNGFTPSTCRRSSSPPTSTPPTHQHAALASEPYSASRSAIATSWSATTQRKRPMLALSELPQPEAVITVSLVTRAALRLWLRYERTRTHVVREQITRRALAPLQAVPTATSATAAALRRRPQVSLRARRGAGGWGAAQGCGGRDRSAASCAGRRAERRPARRAARRLR